MMGVLHPSCNVVAATCHRRRRTQLAMQCVPYTMLSVLRGEEEHDLCRTCLYQRAEEVQLKAENSLKMCESS